MPTLQARQSSIAVFLALLFSAIQSTSSEKYLRSLASTRDQHEKSKTRRDLASEEGPGYVFTPAGIAVDVNIVNNGKINIQTGNDVDCPFNFVADICCTQHNMRYWQLSPMECTVALCGHCLTAPDSAECLCGVEGGLILTIEPRSGELISSIVENSKTNTVGSS